VKGEKYKLTEINENGVEGKIVHPNVFIPLCCINCQHKDWDSWNDGWSSAHYCTLNLRFPTKKGTCKKQKPNSY
jgi:hypothetical protein